MKWRVISAACALVALGATPTVANRALADDSESLFTSYGADASGTGVHVLSYTNGFTNFATGFLDNSYPLAVSHLDAGPASQATATVADTGPLGVTAEGLVKPMVNDQSPQLAALVRQPQYAVATYPGRSADSAGQAASVATALAQQNSAEAHGAIAGVGTSGAVEKPDDIIHTGSDESSSVVTVDPAAGTVRASSAGHVDRASFAAGVLVLGGIDVQASVDATSTTATPHYTIAVGSATVNGTPVAITDKGVVAMNPIPGSDAMNQVINEQLNAQLASAGLQVFVTAPQVKVDGALATVEVSGVHVSFVAPNPNASVPTFTVDYILGEASAFAFGTPADTFDTGSSDTGAEVSASDTLGSGDFGSVSGAVTPLSPEPVVGSLSTGSGPSRAVGGLPVSFKRPRPTWLVPIYVIWQVLMIATGGVLLWSRREVDG